MKETTLQTLITARALLEQAERHCALGDRYLATAGLIVLQDAVELVFLAVLIEKEVDEVRQIEKMSFDEMISTIAQQGIKVPKSGTLKAMNKLRVTAKHFAQVMEPLTVQGHLNVAKFAIDVVLTDVVGKPLREIFLTELVGKTISRPFLDEAVSYLDAGNYLSSLIASRKAFFWEFEHDYCIYAFRERNPNSRINFGGLGVLAGGLKADYYKLNSEFIDNNVKTPFDYVQINYDTWRIDAIECGINTQTLNNIQRLTPELVQLERDGAWYMRQPASYVENNANRENAAACLDLTIEAVRRKHEHIRAGRDPARDKPYETPRAYMGQPLLDKPTLKSKVLHNLSEGDKYGVQEMLSGFNPSQIFYKITCTTDEGHMIIGYVVQINAQPLGQANPWREP